MAKKMTSKEIEYSINRINEIINFLNENADNSHDGTENAKLNIRLREIADEIEIKKLELQEVYVKMRKEGK